MRAVQGLAPAVLEALPERALATAYGVCVGLASRDVLEGFDDDEEVNGGDAVDALADHWDDIRVVAGRAG